MELEHLWADPDPCEPVDDRLEEAAHARQVVDRARLLVLDVPLVVLGPDLRHKRVLMIPRHCHEFGIQANKDLIWRKKRDLQIPTHCHE